jgi:hypothetical protein
MRKKEKDRASAEKKIRNVISSVKMQDRETLFEKGLIDTPEVNNRYRHHQRSRAESAIPTPLPPNAHMLGDDATDEEAEDNDDGGESRGNDSGDKVTLGRKREIEGLELQNEQQKFTLDELLDSVSDFTADSVDEFLKAHPEVAVKVKVMEQNPVAESEEEDGRNVSSKAMLQTMVDDDDNCGGDAPLVGGRMTLGALHSSTPLTSLAALHSSSPLANLADPPSTNHTRILSKDTCNDKAWGGKAEGVGVVAGGSCVEFVKGEVVMYRTGNGTLEEARIINVDTSLVPACYSIMFLDDTVKRHGGARRPCSVDGSEEARVRDTEAHRLIKLPAGVGMGRGVVGGRADDRVGLEVDPETKFYDVSSGRMLHPKLKQHYGPCLRLRSLKRADGSLDHNAPIEEDSSQSSDNGEEEEDDEEGDNDDVCEEAEEEEEEESMVDDRRRTTRGREKSGLFDSGLCSEERRQVQRQVATQEVSEDEENRLAQLESKFSFAPDPSHIPRPRPPAVAEGGLGGVPIVAPSTLGLATGYRFGGSEKEKEENVWRSGVVKPSSAGTTAKKWRVKREMDADDMMADILTYSSKLKNAQRANALVCPYLLVVC